MRSLTDFHHRASLFAFVAALLRLAAVLADNSDTRKAVSGRLRLLLTLRFVCFLRRHCSVRRRLEARVMRQETEVARGSKFKLAAFCTGHEKLAVNTMHAPGEGNTTTMSQNNLLNRCESFTPKY